MTDLDELTGLPEYRNGGLLVDMGLLVPRDARLLTDAYAPGSEPIVEWRALTVALLDERGQARARAAGPHGRAVAAGQGAPGRHVERGPEDRRAEAAGRHAPIRIESDGTVF